MTVFISVLILIQLYFWHFFFDKINKHKNVTDKSNSAKGVSIIICAKNEEKALGLNLPHVLDQNHHSFEVVLADDNSTDLTIEIAKEIDNGRGLIEYCKVKENKTGKKAALLEGFAHSRHNWLLFTDADCHPLTRNWIKSMSNATGKPNIAIVLGYSPYVVKESFLSKWIHFEAWITALQYLSFAIKGIPYMGVGRNMMYKRDLFSKEKILRYEELRSGDDDLTIMQIATRTNTTVCLKKDSFVYSEPASSLRSYLKQKSRHYSTAHAYKISHQIILSIYSFSHLGFYLLFISLIINGQGLIAIISYFTRMLLILPVAQKLMQKLAVPFSLVYFPLLDFLQVFYYIFFSFSVIFPQKKHW